MVLGALHADGTLCVGRVHAPFSYPVISFRMCASSPATVIVVLKVVVACSFAVS